MKIILYLFLLVLTCCQIKNSPTDIEGLTDTIQTNYNPQINKIDSTALIQIKTNDTIFLGFRIGMDHHEYEKHKQNLLQTNKLKNSPNGLIYQIIVNENEALSILDSEEKYPKKNWIGIGLVVPEFFEDKLISISIKFLKTNGNNTYSYFAPMLNKKYYESSPKLYNVFDVEEKLDTLQVGNSITSNIRQKWTHGDINISLYLEKVRRKIGENNIVQIDDVILKYWSENYYSLKKEKGINEEVVEYKELQNDL
jgi:hypothetical protein